jgi:hypothetical protein
MKRNCVIPKCGRKEQARGLCMLHYQRWRRGLLGEELVRPSRYGTGVPKEVKEALK